MAVGSGDWYIRSQGRVLGPFNWSQLMSLRDRGQLSQGHEVSRDRRSWTKAADVPGLYAQATPVRQDQQSTGSRLEWPAIALDDDPGSLAAETAPSWYTARGDTHHGPLLLKDLQRMIDTGEVGPNSLVWKDGMANWVTASQVPELRFGAAAGTELILTGGPSAADQSPRTSAFAVAGLVLGVVWLCGLGSLLATIFGALALSQISRSNGKITGKGSALAGLILGIFGLLIVTLSIAFFLGSVQQQAQRAP